MRNGKHTISQIQIHGEVPNAIAALVACFASMQSKEIDYRTLIENLELKVKTKKGVGFAKKKHKEQNKETQESHLKISSENLLGRGWKKSNETKVTPVVSVWLS